MRLTILFREALIALNIVFSSCVAECVTTMAQGNADAKLSLQGESAGEVREFGDPRIKMCWCPPGEFTMGSPASEDLRFDDEGQVHVTLSSGYWLGQTEVTQGLWKSVMGSLPWAGRELIEEGDNYPAVYISHGGERDEPDSASAFCKQLTEREHRAGRLPTDWRYRLPTEAEWEYACRAGTRTIFSFGEGEAKLGDYAWFDKNAWDVDQKFAHAVATKKPNPWRLHDMHGNVWECCEDFYNAQLLGGEDPIQNAQAEFRVERGGSWSDSDGFARSAARDGLDPMTRTFNLGFRLALSSLAKEKR